MVLPRGRHAVTPWAATTSAGAPGVSMTKTTGPWDFDADRYGARRGPTRVRPTRRGPPRVGSLRTQTSPSGCTTSKTAARQLRRALLHGVQSGVQIERNQAQLRATQT